MINYDAAICYDAHYDHCQVLLNQTKVHQIIYTKYKRQIDFWVKYQFGVLYVSKIEAEEMDGNMPFIEVTKAK